MVRIESTQHVGKAESERETTQSEASIAFDPFLQVAVSAPKMDPLVISDGVETDLGEPRGVASKTLGEPQVESIADLNPAQQAILKMMSSPPRGQDPLGMMAHVEKDLQGVTAQAEPADSAADETVQPGTRTQVRGAEASEPPSAEKMPQRGVEGAARAAGEPAMPREYMAAGRVTNTEASVHGAMKGAESGGIQMPRIEGVKVGSVSVAAVTTGVVGAGSIGNGGSTGTVSVTAVTGVKGMSGTGDRGRNAIGVGQGVGREEGVDEMKVQAQALRGVIAALRKKGEAVTVVLRPEALGRVKVELKFGESGVRGTLTCSTDSARELLDRTVDGLQRAMESRGIVVERLDVVHDSNMDSSDAGAGVRQDGHARDERAPERGGAQGAGGTGLGHHGMAEATAEEVVVIAHDPAFAWNGSRMALSTLA